MKKTKLDPSNTLGVDISHYQNDSGGIDWSQIANPPVPYNRIGFIYIKLTDGKTVDKYGVTNTTNASNSNIPLGYYHFAYPGLNPADVEADAFYDQIVVTGITPTFNYPYMLDLEKNSGLDKGGFLDRVHLFLKTFLARFGAPPGPQVLIYGSRGNLDSWLPTDHDLGTYQLWVAEYGVDEPKIPNGWADWMIWQYSQTGSLPGIIGNVDLNQARPALQTA